MSILFFSDPHLGLQRTANTTPTSRQALQLKMESQLREIIDEHGTDSTGDIKIVCGGDFFDKYSNDEDVIIRAAELYKDLDYCIAGNHDVINKAGSEGSLALLNVMIPGTTDFNEIGRNLWFREEFSDTTLYSIPHIATQELFEEALGKLIAHGTKTSKAGDDHYNIVLLHCNYNMNFEGQSEATLNLTTENAKALLEKFDYVLMGHEHIPADHLDGRLKIIGNTHPTGFSDISNKRVLLWEDGKFEEHQVWNQRNYAPVPWDWDGELGEEVQFVRITGECTPQDMKQVSAYVKKLWKECPNLYGVKLDVKIDGMEGTTDVAHMDIESLPTIISKELEGKPEGALWNELSGGE